MSLVHLYHCEICGAEERNVDHWLLAEVSRNGVLLSHWREELARTPGVRHFCGEAHAQVFVSRYLADPRAYTAYPPAELNPAEKDLTAIQSHLLTRVLQQPEEICSDSDEIFELLAATEAALKGKVTVDFLSSDRFDA